MESKKKHRSLNEYRQVKDTVYRHPHKKKPNHKYNNLIQDIKNLCTQHPNDADLGGALRRFTKKI